jgi:hypothetical protein
VIPVEAVEAAAKVFAVGMWGHYDPEDVPRISNAVREMLEAAAPYMQAQALEVAAKEIIAPGASSTAAAWLIARAAELRSK